MDYSDAKKAANGYAHRLQEGMGIGCADSDLGTDLRLCDEASFACGSVLTPDGGEIIA